MSLFHKKKLDAAELAEDELKTGSADDVKAVLEKYDRESNVRIYEGVPKQIIRYLLAAFSLFAVYMNTIPAWEERLRRPAFVGIIILFIFLLFPARKKSVKAGADATPLRINYIPWYDVVLGVVGAGCFFYFVANFQAIVQRSTRILPLEIWIGVVGIVVLIEACRRVVGIPILCVAGAFLVYAFSSGYSLKTIIYNLFYTTNGVIGVPIGVCSTYIVLFIIFGAFLEMTGISDFFIEAANAIAGAAAGGPAKVAVISSALCGMVSGSSVANTVTTGSVTIPMMKRIGYKGEFAGAVEAAASTGGQIMPPIMGAAAFLMAEMVGMPYATIATRAILPALLYFTGVFLIVHLEAKKLGLKGLPREELPKIRGLFSRCYLLLPLVVLIWLVVSGKTMPRAAVIATVMAIIVSMFRKETRMTPSSFITALENGARGTLSVTIACAIAGIIAGVVTMTGLGQLLISAIVSVAGNVTIIALFLTMITCIVLGMGIPTTATYIIMATTCAPILVTGMGVDVLAAHMFVFYFGIVADITPPVALAAYAGSAIAHSNPMKTAMNASKLAIAGFIVPYIFALSPAMLMVNATVLQVITITVTSLIGIFSIASGVEGFMFRPLRVWQRIPALIGGLLLIDPHFTTDLIGFAIIVFVFASEFIHAGKKA